MEEYDGTNPWHEAVQIGCGLSCCRCRCFYQGEEEWREFLGWDSGRWCVLVAKEARALGWKRLGWDRFLCPTCAWKRKRGPESDGAQP